jgi:hypothetical protein
MKSEIDRLCLTVPYLALCTQLLATYYSQSFGCCCYSPLGPSSRWGPYWLKRWEKTGNIHDFETLAAMRIERTDFLTRIAPMLGLMGTLIPLGPGLAALGEGELSILTTAMSVAFDTTVLGLLVGIIGFVAGRLRRRWYEQTLNLMEANEVDE